MSTQTATRPANGQAAPERVNYLTPVANILETDDGYILQTEMPGVGKDGLEVTVENDELVIIGRRASAHQQLGTALYRESRPLDFRRLFDLDPSIDASRISAKMDQGVLTLTLPKAEQVKPRRIEVND